MLNKTLKHIADSLDSAEKAELLYYLQLDNTKEDILSRMPDDTLLTAEEITKIVDVVADKYLLDLEYDCNCSYWENLDNLIFFEISKDEYAHSKT